MPLVIRTTGWADFFDPAGGSWIKELMLGVPDVGKTRSASFWPKPIFADCEDGRMSLADRAVPYGRIRSTADMDGLLTELEFDSKRTPDRRKYQTLVVDTIDHYQKLMIAERLRSEGKEALAGWADWGWLDGEMQKFIQRLLNLEMNIIVNCHFKTVEVGDDENKTTMQTLRLKGDVKDWLLEEFDLIGMMESYMVAEDGKRVRKRRVRWHNEPAYPLLKDRSGQLPQFTEIDFTEADYTRMFENLMSNVDSLPQNTTVEEIETPEPVAAADPDLTGGPVEPGRLPTKPVPAKRAVAKKGMKTLEPGEAKITEKKVKTPVAAETPVEPAATVSTDVPMPVADLVDETPEEPKTPLSRDEEAVKLVEDKLGGEVLSVEPTGALPDKYCGKQPQSHSAFPKVEGCGKDLATENVAKVNLALLRAKTMLCTDCFTKWKTTQAEQANA